MKRNTGYVFMKHKGVEREGAIPSFLIWENKFITGMQNLRFS